MNHKDHTRTQVMIVELAKQIGKLDLDAYLGDLKKVDEVADKIDPKIRERVIKNVYAMREMTEVFIIVKSKLDNMRDLIVEAEALKKKAQEEG